MGPERQCQIFELAGVAIAVLDPEGRVADVNRAMVEVTGLSRDALVGRSAEALFGRPTRLGDPAIEAELRSPGGIELETTLPDGSGRRSVRMAVCRLPDGCLLVQLRDISAERALEARLRELEARATLTGLTEGIAGDFQRLLTLVLGHAELAREQAREGSPLRSHLDRILAAAAQAGVLSRHLATWCRAAGAPVSRARPAPRTPSAGAEGADAAEIGMRGTVLVAEDEEVLRELTCEILAGRGLSVMAAVDGEEALELAAAHRGTIDVLLTDMVMPRLGGAALAARLRDRCPGLRVVFMSGYAEPALPAEGGLHDALLLAKPFDSAELLSAVGRALAAAG